MTLPPTGRRASDQHTGGPPHLVALLREWLPALLCVLAFFGAQVQPPSSRFERLERELAANRVVDSLSIVDREALYVATQEAFTLVGRIQCRTMSDTEAADRGYPCSALRTGARWPMPARPSLRLTGDAWRGVPPLPTSRGPAGYAALASLVLVPAAPVVGR